MQCFIYVLGSNGKGGHRTYVGWTTDIEQRLAKHNAGKGARSTRGRTWILLYSERHTDRRAAMRREWHLKRDRKFRKSLLPMLAAAIVEQGRNDPRSRNSQCAPEPKIDASCIRG